MRHPLSHALVWNKRDFMNRRCKLVHRAMSYRPHVIRLSLCCLCAHKVGVYRPNSIRLVVWWARIVPVYDLERSFHSQSELQIRSVQSTAIFRLTRFIQTRRVVQIDSDRSRSHTDTIRSVSTEMFRLVKISSIIAEWSWFSVGSDQVVSVWTAAFTGILSREWASRPYLLAIVPARLSILDCSQQR